MSAAPPRHQPRRECFYTSVFRSFHSDRCKDNKNTQFVIFLVTLQRLLFTHADESRPSTQRREITTVENRWRALGVLSDHVWSFQIFPISCSNLHCNISHSGCCWVCFFFGFFLPSGLLLIVLAHVFSLHCSWYREDKWSSSSSWFFRGIDGTVVDEIHFSTKYRLWTVSLVLGFF